MMTIDNEGEGGREIKNAENLMTSYVNDPFCMFLMLELLSNSSCGL